MPTETPVPTETPAPTETPNMLPVLPPRITPGDGTLVPERTPPMETPVIGPIPQETQLPILISTGAPLIGSAGLMAGEDDSLGYTQIITRWFDHTIRQIELFFTPGGNHDSDLPPEYRLPVAPDAR